MRWLLVAPALLFAPLQAAAQDSFVVIPWSAAAAPTYTGPGDIVSFTAWWGVRAYSGAIVTAGTQALVNLSRASDSHTCDIIVSGTGGLGNTANCSTGGDNGTAVATWCSATTCSVTEAYDQTGNGNNVVQATGANRPALVFVCGSGATRCFQITASTALLASSSNFTPASGKVSITAAYLDNSVAGGFRALAQNGSNNRLSPTNTTVVLTGGTSGSIAATAGGSSYHSVNAVMDGVSSVVNVDGTETTGTVTGNTTAGAIQFANANGTGATARSILEGGFLDNADFTGTQRTNLCKNTQAYYTGVSFGAAC